MAGRDQPAQGDAELRHGRRQLPDASGEKETAARLARARPRQRQTRTQARHAQVVFTAGGQAQRGSVRRRYVQRCCGVGGEAVLRVALAHHGAARGDGAHALGSVAGRQQRVDRVAHQSVPVRAGADSVGVFPAVVRVGYVFRRVRERAGEGGGRCPGALRRRPCFAHHVGAFGAQVGAREWSAGAAGERAFAVGVDRGGQPESRRQIVGWVLVNQGLRFVPHVAVQAE